MIRLYRLCLTWICAFIISIAGTLWVNGKEETKNEEVLDLNAKAAVLLDGHTGRVLYGKNEKEPLAMASTTKIMTCLIALENAKLDDKVMISDYAASMPDVQLNAAAGDTFYMKDLLYSLMLESHNDVAVAIAEHVGGSEEHFAELMNDRAKEIGCIHTNFVTANGLDAKNHYTTAEELGKITYEALQNEIFVEIINTREYKFSNIEDTKNYYVYNKNKFLDMMPGAYGVKTGYTNQAGYCFVGAIDDHNETFISVVLGSGWPPHQNVKWQDTKTLMNYGLQYYDLQWVGVDQLELGTLSIIDGIENEVNLLVDCEKEKLLVKESDQISIRILRELQKQAPVVENEIVGWVYYLINNNPVCKYPIYIQESIKEKTYGYCLCKTLCILWMD